MNATTLPSWTLLGGAFDPPHLGHLDVIRGLLAEGHRVRLGVDPASALKRNHAPADVRKHMVERLLDSQLAPNERSCVHLEMCEPRAWDWIARVRGETGAGRTDLLYTIGIDQVHQLDRWFRFPEILDQCAWGTWDRSGLAPTALPAWSSRMKRLPGIRARALSSTEIRRTLARRDLTAEEIPATTGPAVWALIQEKHLYGT